MVPVKARGVEKGPVTIVTTANFVLDMANSSKVVRFVI
jgi:hypothetical protein